MAETKTYTGGCHCGEVRFEVTTDLSSVVACNCSICQKRGALWSFVPAEHFALRAGDEDLKDYQFGKKTIHHLFCAQCGVGAFSRGKTPKRRGDGRGQRALPRRRRHRGAHAHAVRRPQLVVSVIVRNSEASSSPTCPGRA